MLGQLLSSVMSASKPTGRSGGTDPNAAAYRSLLASMVKPGSGYSPAQVAAVIEGAPSNVDTSAYSAIMGMQTSEQKAKRQVNDKIYSDFLTILNSGQPPGQQAVTPAPVPGPTAAPTPQVAQPRPPVAKPSGLPARLFTEDFVVRKVLKDLSGIDVGGHYLESEDWFKSYGKKVDAGVPVSQAMSNTAVEYGFIPSGASNLKDLSEAERQVIAEREIQTALNDKTLDSIFRKITPEGANVQKTKLGHILGAFAEQGLYIPKHYQPFLDRFRGLTTPEFIDDETKTWIYKTTRKYPSEIEPSDVAKAQEEMHLNHIIETAQLAAARTTGQTTAQWEMEKSRPLSGEIRTKYGIGSKYSTFRELADAGLRFPTEGENKEYRDLTDLVVIMEDKLKPLIDKIFTSQDNYGSRIAHGGRIQAAMALGEDLGITAQQYSRQLAIFSKKMLSMVERGGRFTDQDYQKMLESLPKVNFAMPDGKILAGRLLEDARVMLGQKLELYEGLIVKPIGQPTAPSASSEADAAAQSLIDEYTKENK